MYLKALEIQGFKSFPEKVRLSFEKEITAIVGPNGSGKSNISDALTWVMGEQSSKALRGSKMEDVIFGGAEHRSQLGFAQVSLVIDNSAGIFNVDTPELTVTRRYYRSGESEYFINKNSVRLKDINEIFMDTGLGRDGYAVIGQGKVDEILSAKSEDRREIFEEAAGISKYRYRKEEAERKLLKTEENLVRVNDKISELELQVEPLRVQAEVAKKYLVLRDQLRELEISLWMETLDKLEKRTSTIKDEFERTGTLLEEKKRKLEQHYEDASVFSEQIRNADVAAEGIRSEISALETQIAELESQNAALSADLRNNEESIKRLVQELEERQSRDKGLAEQIDRRKERISQIEDQILQINEKYSGLRLENEKTNSYAGEKEKEIGRLLAEASEFDSLCTAAAARSEALRQSASELEQRIDGNETELKKILDRIDEERKTYTEKRSELIKLREEEQSAENMLRGYEIKVRSREKRAAEFAESNRKLQMELNALTSRISLLSAMEKDYEGFSNAVKLVMRESKRGTLKNIHGTVAELVKTDDKYTVAVETALGASMQSIVVEREEDGKSAIMMLKQRDGGRATFLPVSTIKGSELSQPGIMDEEGVEGVAVRLVRFEKKYDGIFMNLLGRTLIVDNMDCAIRLSRKYSSRFRIVTLDGQVINAGGSMTGGSAASNVGILSRANEIIRLRQREEALKKEIEEHAKKHGEAERELNLAVYEMETAQADCRRIKDEVLRLEAEISQRKILIESLESSCEAYKNSKDELKGKLINTEKEIAEAESSIEENRKKSSTLRTEAERLSQGQEELRKKLEELSAQLSRLLQEESSLSAEKDAILRAISEWERLLEEFSLESEQKTAASAVLEEKNREIRSRIEENQSIKAKLKIMIDEKKKKLTDKVNEKLEIEARRSASDKRSQDLSREIMELEREHSGLEQKILTAELEEKQIIDKLWDTYELSRSAAQRIRMELESVSKAQKRVAELKREISKLGTPNLGAIEEFERVNARYTYLTEQRDDIQKAKTELEKIIKDITNEMKTIFAREFGIINESFKETFRELFGGGRAELVLEDENDILNCGIDIRVQPPGKTPKTLTLLSGGERAFVAIAIHFAILKVRPTPFCVFDEIETALDEKNVERFAKYLRKMSDKTQFLIITHRRSTMEEADVLYGVTMQNGVSKVLSIDLERALA